MPGPRLETARLVLRPPLLADFDAWAAFAADERVGRFLGGVQSRSAAWRGLMTIAGAWALEGYAMFSVLEKTTGRWIGRVGPWKPEGWPGCEVGWGLIPEADEIVHVIDPANQASRWVARKLGSSVLRQAFLPPPIEAPEIDVWGQTRGEWMRRRRQAGR
jgi:RimJ/RimL family protein N-acetyltransferase